MKKVLIVDDDPDVREACQLILEGEGFHVSLAASKSEGLAALESYQPHLLVLDVIMDLPDDGFTMAREIRARGNELPIMMLTSIGYVTGQHFEKHPEMAPVDAFFEKPLSKTRFLEAVHCLVDTKED